MSSDAMRLVVPACLCAGIGAVLAAASGARPDGLRDDATLFAAAQPMIGLRPGPGFFAFTHPAAPAAPKEAERPRRVRPTIDLSPIDTRLNDTGFALIAETEGLRLRAYFLAGQWLVGYGHARLAYEG
ncbi:MAG: hypothetical protein K2Q06_06225, partial [Parvularculaceae bacterium]|nr:hypothetical protein [Parvularculaceae bacterium]